MAKKRKITLIGETITECEGGLKMIRQPDFRTTLVMFKGHKPLYGFKIKLKLNHEAKEIIQKTDMLAEMTSKLDNVSEQLIKLFASEINRLYKQPNGTTFDKTQFDYNGKFE